jgi:hypothetical protein
MRLKLTVAVLLLVMTTPAQAIAPGLSVSQKLKHMDKEERVEYAIGTVTKDKSEARCAKKIAYKESRYNIDSVNKSSGARGVWQLMWGKPHWDILKQVQEAHKYVLHRYDTWCGAYRFHQERNWY